MQLVIPRPTVRVAPAFFPLGPSFSRARGDRKFILGSESWETHPAEEQRVVFVLNGRASEGSTGAPRRAATRRYGKDNICPCSLRVPGLSRSARLGRAVPRYER